MGAQNHPLGGYCKAGQNPQKCHGPPGTEGGCSCSQGGTWAPDMLLPTQHQCSLVTFNLSSAWDEASSVPLFLQSPLQRDFPSLSQHHGHPRGWTSTGTALGSACFLPLWKKPFPSLAPLAEGKAASLLKVEVISLQVRVRNPDVSFFPRQAERRRHFPNSSSTPQCQRLPPAHRS